MSYQFAGLYAQQLVDPNGKPQPNTAVSVYLLGTATPASLYTDRTKSVAGPNPVTTDGLGNLNFFADPGEYTLSLNGGTTVAEVPVDPQEGITVATTTLYAATWGNDTNSGLSWGQAKATIGAALTTLGSSPGTITVGPGSFRVTAADTNGNALTLSHVGQRIVGSGYLATYIFIGASVTWGVLLAATGCQVTDLTVQLDAGGACTWLCGVSSLTSPGSSESAIFTRVQSVNGQAGVTVAAAFALGPDHAGSASIDTANSLFDHCIVNAVGGGIITHGFLSGNGTTGNVVQNWARDCAVFGTVNGVTWNGGGLWCYRMGMSGVTAADYNLVHAAGDPFIVDGTRNENGNQLLLCGYAGPLPQTFTLKDAYAKNYTPTGSGAGQIITWDSQAPLLIIGGCAQTTLANTSIGVNTSGAGFVSQLTAINWTADTANPFPARNTARYLRTIIGYQQTIANVPTPVPSLAYLCDGTSTSILVKSSRGVTSGALPTVTLTSGVGAQIDTTCDRDLHVPVTLTAVGGTCVVAVSADNVTYSTLVTLTPGVNGAVVDATALVPAGWYTKLTATNATLGTGTFY